MKEASVCYEGEKEAKPKWHPVYKYEEMNSHKWDVPLKNYSKKEKVGEVLCSFIIGDGQ